MWPQNLQLDWVTVMLFVTTVKPSSLRSNLVRRTIKPHNVKRVK